MKEDEKVTISRNFAVKFICEALAVEIGVARLAVLLEIGFADEMGGALVRPVGAWGDEQVKAAFKARYPKNVKIEWEF